jgi:tRNA pseudouridine38-40 synthase
MTLFDDVEAPVEVRTRVRMVVAYVGTGFRGFAAPPGVKTVAGSLVEATSKVLKHPLELTCAGRTDAGVHAWGQVVHFDSPLEADELDLVTLQRALNKMLKPHIVVRAVDVAPEGFDARRSATARRYRYTIVNRDVPDPFLAHLAWHVDEPLDLRAMQAACDPFIGEHDFAAFCKKPPEGGSTFRRVVDARWLDLGGGVLRFDVEASSFCQQMVRSMVGTLVDVGLGRKRAGEMAWIIRTKDRHKAGPPAPPHGLCLWEVLY